MTVQDLTQLIGALGKFEATNHAPDPTQSGIPSKQATQPVSVQSLSATASQFFPLLTSSALTGL